MQAAIVGTNSLPRPKKVLILKCLVEGMSLRSTARIAALSRNTVASLLAEAGKARSAYQVQTLPDLPCKRIQCGEIRAFVYARQNTRLTNAFSKRVEYLGHSVALHFMHYNFCRIHQTLRITPAKAAGVTQELLEIGDIVNVVEAAAP